jgi:hypothetical protein
VWFEPSSAHQTFVTQTNTHGVAPVGVVVEGLFPGLPVDVMVAWGLRGHEVADGRAQERAEGFSEVGADIAAALDVDALEERLIDLPLRSVTLKRRSSESKRSSASHARLASAEQRRGSPIDPSKPPSSALGPGGGL